MTLFRVGINHGGTLSHHVETIRYCGRIHAVLWTACDGACRLRRRAPVTNVPPWVRRRPRPLPSAATPLRRRPSKKTRHGRPSRAASGAASIPSCRVRVPSPTKRDRFPSGSSTRARATRARGIYFAWQRCWWSVSKGSRRCRSLSQGKPIEEVFFFLRPFQVDSALKSRCPPQTPFLRADGR